MREIKFRAWHKEEKIIGEVLGIDILHKEIFFSNEDVDCYEHTDFKDIELMQYTGLKDKNSKEIYEKDIVSCNKYKNIVVFFENGCFKVRYPKNDTTNIICTLDTFLEKYKCKISGNIYENFELLEENK